MMVKIRWISRIILSLAAPREDFEFGDMLARRLSSRASSRSFVVMRERIVLEFMALWESG